MNLLLFKDIQSRPNFLRDVSDGIERLKASGILEALRDHGRPITANTESANFEAIQLASANQAIGYWAAIDDIQYFYERFIEPRVTRDPGPQTYGSLEYAVEQGNLTQEEANAIRSGSTISGYDASGKPQYTTNKS